MLALLWYIFLYQPLFNILIWLYSNVADHNLGWAVVWLTIILRVILLPLTIVSEFAAMRRHKANAEAEAAIKAYRNDPLAQRAAARKIARKYHLSPWAKVISLGVQLLVLILLYQVFIRGINGDKILKILYPFIDFPGQINTSFYGFEVGARHTLFWPGLAALYLFVSIFLEKRQNKGWDRQQMYFLLFFPLFTLAILWYLPMVKSLFILTTMIFSDIVGIIIGTVRWMFKPKAKMAH